MKFVHPVHKKPDLHSEKPKGPGPGGDWKKFHQPPVDLLPPIGHGISRDKPGDRTDFGPGPGPGGDIDKHHHVPDGLLSGIGDHSIKKDKPHVGTDDSISSWSEYQQEHGPLSHYND